MARKELGYVELEWSCAVCKTRNPGTQTTCSGCGAAQPADVQFEAPTAATLTQDTTQIKRAQTGPDLHCAFCGTRNSATAASCRQCGADLSAGRARSAGGVVGEVCVSLPHWPIDGQAVALRLCKARTAGPTSKGQFALKRFNAINGLVLGLFKAQPVKQTCSPHAQASARL